jgi:DNA helicase-2/ATP-dependent DNA helicase PcrA
VLVHRIAWLIQIENASSEQHLLSVTFTPNKALPAEMRHRKQMFASAQWHNGTFHGLAHRPLRAEQQPPGENFRNLMF